MSVCCTYSCGNAKDCMRSGMNKVGTYAVVSYGTCCSNDKPMCGKENNYRLFESKVRKDEGTP